MSALDAGHAAALEAIKDMAPVVSTGGDGLQTPEPGTTPTTTPEGTQSAEGTTDPDSFTKLDPNALPPELQPFYRSMQGDYTRSKQEIAPFRGIAEETGLDADGLRSAAELYAALQDPQQLVQFHSELTNALMESGLSPAEAQAAATEHITGAPAADPLEGLDPEERRVAELEARLARFEEQQRADAESRAEQMRQAAFVAEMNRQEQLIKDQHKDDPTFTQADLDFIYELSAFYGGSLVDAHDRYMDGVSDRVARILSGKGAVASSPAFTPAPPAVPGVTRPQKFADVDEAHKAAMELVRRMPPIPRS